MSSTAKDGDTENSKSVLSASAVMSRAREASPAVVAGRNARQRALPPSDCAWAASRLNILPYSSVFRLFSSNMLTFCCVSFRGFACHPRRIRTRHSAPNGQAFAPHSACMCHASQGCAGARPVCTVTRDVPQAAGLSPQARIFASNAFSRAARMSAISAAISSSVRVRSTEEKVKFIATLFSPSPICAPR